MLKKFFKRAFLVFSVLVVAAVVAILALPLTIVDTETVKAVFHPAKSAFGQKRSLHILLLGVDYNYDSKAQRHTKGARSDTILLLRVEPLGRELSMLSIPRDLMVGIGENAIHGYERINAAYSYGGEKMAIQTVEQLTGLKIDHHIVVKSDVVEELVDTIGGVPIEVEKRMDWDDNWAGLHIHLKPGHQVLSGKDAVGYCRFRRDAEGDFGRIKRQQKFLGALLKELKKPKHIRKARELAKVVRSKLKTDLSDEQLLGLALVYRNFPLQNIRKGRPEVEDYFANGSAYLILAPGEPNEIVKKLFPPLPDPAANEIDMIIETGPHFKPEAKRINRILKERGFRSVRIRIGAETKGATTLTSAGLEGRPLQVLRDTFPELRVEKEKKKGRPVATLQLRSDIYISENL